jgi:hypothetical protein
MVKALKKYKNVEGEKKLADLAMFLLSFAY